MTRKIIIFLLLILISNLYAKDVLYNGIKSDNTNYFLIGNKNTIKIVNKKLEILKKYENVIAFDIYKNKYIVIITNKNLWILDKNLKQFYSKTIKTHNFFHNSNKLFGLHLVKDKFLIVPTTIPSIFNIETKKSVNFYQLFSLTGNIFNFYSFDIVKNYGNYFGFIEKNTLNLLNFQNGNVSKIFVDGEYLSKIENKIKNNLIFKIDNKTNYHYNLKNQKVEQIEKLKRKDKNSINFKHLFNNLEYKVKIEILNTSIFSALSAWKKGIGNGKIIITDKKDNIKLSKLFNFSLKELNNSDFDIDTLNTYLKIKLPEKDIIILNNNDFQITEINKNINYCVCGNQIYTLKNNKIQLHK